MPAPRALVLRGGAVGDFILTLPAIRLLREGLPVTPHVEILGYPTLTALAETAGLANATRPLEHAGLAPFFIPNAELDSQWREYFASFTIILSYLFDPDDIFHTNLARVTNATILRGSGKIDTTPHAPHATAQLAAPLEELALFPEPEALRPHLPLSPDPTYSDHIALHPGSGSTAKNWGHHNFLALANLFPKNTPFLITSGEVEHNTIDALLTALTTAGIPHQHLQYAPLPQVARALAACTLYIGADTGITHLAAATDTPTIALFGPTDPNIWSPKNAKVIHSPLTKITPAQVYSEAKALNL